MGSDALVNRPDQVPALTIWQETLSLLKVKVTQSCLTVCDPMDMGFSRPGYWNGSLSLLQGIFPTHPAAESWVYLCLWPSAFPLTAPECPAATELRGEDGVWPLGSVCEPTASITSVAGISSLFLYFLFYPHFHAKF